MAYKLYMNCILYKLYVNCISGPISFIINSYYTIIKYKIVVKKDKQIQCFLVLLLIQCLKSNCQKVKTTRSKSLKIL